MNYFEFADMINKQIVIRYYPNQSGRFSADFYGGEIKKNGCLLSEHGDGKTPEEAISDYFKKIEGKTIVFGAYTKQRTEYVIPMGIKQ